jgi:hypothetical protein
MLDHTQIAAVESVEIHISQGEAITPRDMGQAAGP